jgi:hypothetical protein
MECFSLLLVRFIPLEETIAGSWDPKPSYKKDRQFKLIFLKKNKYSLLTSKPQRVKHLLLLIQMGLFTNGEQTNSCPQIIQFWIDLDT